VVHGRSAERGAETVRDIENSGCKACFVAADVNEADDVRRLAAEAGPVDILINNAGIYRFGGTTDTTDAGFDDAREIASAVVFLSSTNASYVNGEIPHATGGQRAASA
jgi:NAD(P)-dependent dehydrogenase (short-subunit alcohol dehydrogenase family)